MVLTNNIMSYLFNKKSSNVFKYLTSFSQILEKKILAKFAI